MPDTASHHLAGPRSEILDQIRRAALLIVDRYGSDGVDAAPHVRSTHHAGFLIAYFRCEPGTLGRRDGGNWNTPPGAAADAIQHVLDIRIGEHVAGLGWRGDGPVRTDRLRRGPWEFELLKAAGLSKPLPVGTCRPAFGAPEATSRWAMKNSLEFMACFRRLSLTLTITVIGYRRCISQIVEPGADFSRLREALEDCYGESRTSDGEVYLKDGPVSCFSLQARIGSRLSRSGRTIGRPALRYFIGSDDSLSVAAALLLAFDREMSVTTSSALPFRQERSRGRNSKSDYRASHAA